VEQTPVPIAGQTVTTEAAVEVTNPHDGEVIAEVPLCDATHVDRACRHARDQLRRDDFPQRARAEVLERAAVLVRERREQLATTIAREAGKPIRTARVEATRCVDTLTFAAVEARRLSGEMIATEASASGAGKVAFAVRVPAGVVGAITPFNFPLNLVAHKLAPAIAAGCPVVLKPAPQTPLSAIGLVDLLVEAGMPKDWISIVTDAGRDAGAPLVEHEIPAVITFTGSAAVGWSIAAAAPRKRVLLELGSNSPVIVEPDADIQHAADRITVGGFSYSGQSCISVQRVLVHRDVHDELVAALAEGASSLVVGDPLSEDTDVGPLIKPGEVQRVSAWIEEAVADGATVVAGGEVENGVLRPTVVTGAPPTSNLCVQEVFGPVVTVTSYASFDEAIRMANDSAYGLHAGVFTNHLGRALQAARELDFGGVLVNEIPTFRADQQPYGGERDAGNTREGPAYAVEEMTHLRFVSLQG